MKAVIPIALVAFLAAAVLVLVPACEDGEGTHSLGVYPSYVELGTGTNHVVFSVSSNDLRSLSMPLTWWVEDGSLGAITTSGGASAVYTARSGRTGVNVVWVKDQYDAQGSATVEQK